MPGCSVYKCRSRSSTQRGKKSENLTNCQYKIEEENGIVQIEIGIRYSIYIFWGALARAPVPKNLDL